MDDFHGNVTALSAASGLVDWTRQIAGRYGNQSWTGCFAGRGNIRGIDATPTVWGGMLFTPTGNNNFTALYISNGTTVPGWPVEMANHSLKGVKDSWKSYFPYGSPLVYNGSVYVGTASGCDNPTIDGQLLQINIAHPAVVNNFSAGQLTANGGGIWSTPALLRQHNNGTVWVTTGNTNISPCKWCQSIVSLNASDVCFPLSGGCTTDGYYQVTSALGDDDFGAGATIFANPTNQTPMVVSMNKNGTAMAFYASTLKSTGTDTPSWTAQIASPSSYGLNIAPAAFNGTALFFGGSHTSFNRTVCPIGSVQALNPVSGKPLWQKCAPGFVRAGLTYADGLVIDAADTLGNASSTVELRNSSSGVVIASLSVNQTVVGQPIVADGRLFFATGDWNTFCGATRATCPFGYVYAYGLPLVVAQSSLRPSIILPPATLQGIALPAGGMPTYSALWDWGRSSTGGFHATHTVPGNGTFYYTLTLQDAAGDLAQERWLVYAHHNTCPPFLFCQTWTVYTVPCAQLQVCIVTGQTPQPATFGGWTVYGSGAVTWLWSFGDGSQPSTFANPTHYYAAHGTYTVVVTATDDAHNVSTETFQVTV